MPDFYQQIQQQLDQLRAADQYRSLSAPPDVDAPQADASLDVTTQDDTSGCVNLSSNDYLGLAGRSDLADQFYAPERIADNPAAYRLSASSSRLLTGNHPGYDALESQLTTMYTGRASLVFSSGYHTNVGILPALAGPRDLILSDRLNHASIIDGMRLADCKFQRYPHLDYDRLEQLLIKHRTSKSGQTLKQGQMAYENIFIVTESVFSMDGDRADLQRLVELKQRYNAVLIVDEAHACGVFGATGCGLSEAVGAMSDIDVIVGTFGKAYASVGAYAVMEPMVREYLVNTMRPLIFSTALPPVVTGWTRLVLQESVGMSDRREYLQRLAARLRDGLKSLGLTTLGDSQIVPLIVGDNAKAVALAEKLRDAGLWVFPIRPPTVPPGTARLRFSLHAGLSESEIDRIIAELR